MPSSSGRSSRSSATSGAWSLRASTSDGQAWSPEDAGTTRTRHRAALTEALARLTEAETAPLPELAAEAYRGAVMALGRLTGRVGVEDVLDVVFGDFCIGK